MDAALTLAQPFHGHVDALHLRVDVTELEALVNTVHPHPGGGARRLARNATRDGQERSQSALKAFSRACALQEKSRKAKNSPTAAFQEVVALEDPTLSWARIHDATVAARVPELLSTRLGDFVMGAGKPVLVPPAKPAASIGKTIVIAWKDAPEAARAVTAALPLLAHAKRVIVACVVEGKSSAERKSAEGLIRQLQRHAIKSELCVEPAGQSPGAETLKQIAYGAGADLIVMGAYGHSRTHEWIFGGMTRALLAQCDISVLMIH